MKNDFIEAYNEPKGSCLQNGGKNDCPKWPDITPSPCCWLSCDKLCGAACWNAKKEYGSKCEHFGGEYCDSASAC